MLDPSAPESEQDDTSYYPCVGICIVDESGHCIGCGRPAEAVSETLRDDPVTEHHHDE